MLSADPAASQLRAALDANRKRSTKWTTAAEIGLLTEFWGATRRTSLQLRLQRAAARRAGQEGVLRAGRQTEAQAPEARAPGGNLRVASTHACRRSRGDVPRVQASSRRPRPPAGGQALHTMHGRKFPRSAALRGAQVASSKDYGTCTWEQATVRDDVEDGALPDQKARRPTPTPTNG